MKIAVVNIYSFPRGMAPSNRIIAYSKGLVSNSDDVHLITIEPNCSYTDTDIEPDYGRFDNISYIYPSGRYKSKYKIFRALSYFSKYRLLHGLFKTCKYIKKQNFDAAIFSFDDPLYLYLYEKLLHKYIDKIYFIFDEYPIPIRHKLKSDIPTWKKELYKIILPKYDGYISISKKLLEYYNSFAEKPSFCMPVIVDTHKFNVPATPRDNNKIIYMGNMELSKDNVPLIIKAFSKIKMKYKDVTLHLYGASSDDMVSKMNAIINEYDLTGAAFVHKKISSERVPTVLAEAKVLVSSQPNTLRAAGGFPTKFGEYLSMGIPTLITNVGENASYVTPNVDCFFANPDDVDDYASKLDYILSNYDKALAKASNGRNLVYNKYSSEVVGKSLSDFLRK